MTGKRLKTVFTELRRRRVFNTVALYIVGAWVALQVADLAFPGMDIPDSAIRYVWIGAFVLFPLVLIFGWRYDISRDGIRRTLPAGAEAGRAGNLRPADRVYIGGLAAVAMAVVAVVLVRIGQVEPEILRAAPENSIAVLPFEVCEGHTADQAIAYQLSDEVLNRLAERGTMKIIARATAYNLAGFGWSAPRVSQTLGVQYVLTGAVCRNGDALILAAELRDKKDFIVIRESYEQVVNQFDQIELHVAAQVANAVAAQLGNVTPFSADAPVNRLAYEQLLRGRQFSEHQDWEQAAESFRRALELQPGYPEAVFSLAIMELRLNPEKAKVERLALARQKAEEALELAMGEIERGAGDFNAHFVTAKIQHALAHWDQAALWREAGKLDDVEIERRKYQSLQRFAESERHFRTALRINPSHTETYEWLTETIEHQGIERRGEAFEMMQRSLARDPYNKDLCKDLAFRFAKRGRYREAMDLLDRFTALPGGKHGLWWTILEIQNNGGRVDEELATLIEMLRTEPESLLRPSHLWWLPNFVAGLGAEEEAEFLYRQIGKIPVAEDEIWWHRVFFEESYLYSTGRGKEVAERNIIKYQSMSNQEILDTWRVEVRGVAGYFWTAGERQRAIELYEGLRHIELDTTWSERQTMDDSWLAMMYVEVGRIEDAREIFEQAVDYLEREVTTGIRHPLTLWLLSQAHAFLGNRDKALDRLEMAVDYGMHQIKLFELERFPEFNRIVWEPFSDDPRFLAQMDRMKAIREQQATNIRSLLKRNDLESLLQPVIEQKRIKLAEAAAVAAVEQEK